LIRDLEVAGTELRSGASQNKVFTHFQQEPDLSWDFLHDNIEKCQILYQESGKTSAEKSEMLLVAPTIPTLKTRDTYVSES
jgi:hypothetical protein